jgi:hypothetical protein
MGFWITFWGCLLVVVLLVYAMLAVAITIGGFFDVREMLATLEKQHQADEAKNGTTDAHR